MSPDDPIIRPAVTPADFRACQEAQRRAWRLDDGSAYLVPVATLAGAAHHGGLVLGAFLPDGSAVGVSFAFLGRLDGESGHSASWFLEGIGDRPILYSQLTGVAPDYQGRGVGDRLKRAQRDWAAAHGLDWVAWAFDPLQARNAEFNLRRLGAVGVRYVDDMYGPRTDPLNAGAPTDRLIAAWPTDPDARAVRAPSIGPEELAGFPGWFPVVAGADGLWMPVDGPTPAPPDAEFALLEIPADLARLRDARPDRLAGWRLAVRAAFHGAFAAGYLVLSCQRVGPDRAAYVLGRRRAVEP